MELHRLVVAMLVALVGVATSHYSPPASSTSSQSPAEPKALPRLDTKIIHVDGGGGDGGGGTGASSGPGDHSKLILPKEKTYYVHPSYHNQHDLESNPLKGPHIVIEETHELPDPDSHIKTEEILIPVSDPSHHKLHHPHPSMVKIENPRSPIMLHVVSPHMRRKHESSIPDLLAILAPLAAIPLLGSLAVSSFTTMLTLTGLGGRRRKREATIHNQVLDFLSGRTNQSSASYYHPVNTTNTIENILTKFDDPPERPVPTMPNTPPSNNFEPFNKSSVAISELFQLDIVQQYLRQSGRPDHNDEIIASYLACRGMFASDNHCLERLACHYADTHNGRLRPLERDVAALIIYSLLRNGHIDNSFKRRLQRAALFGHDHHQRAESSADQISFVPLCDREFPCPKSDMS